MILLLTQEGNNTEWFVFYVSPCTPPLPSKKMARAPSLPCHREGCKAKPEVARREPLFLTRVFQVLGYGGSIREVTEFGVRLEDEGADRCTELPEEENDCPQLKGALRSVEPPEKRPTASLLQTSGGFVSTENNSQVVLQARHCSGHLSQPRPPHTR